MTTESMAEMTRRWTANGTAAAGPGADVALASAEAATTAPPRHADGQQPDRALVAELRGRVSDKLLPQARAADRGLAELDPAVVREQIRQVLDDWIRDEHRAGRAVVSAERETGLGRAILDGMVGLGRLQPLLEIEGVDNITINGYDSVWISYGDGRKERIAPLVESDEDLVSELSWICQVYGRGRMISPSTPILQLRLPDGSRLQAMLGSWRPLVAIRLHRLKDVTIDQLVTDYGTLDPCLAGFLVAAVRAQMNILIAGATDAGKTSLLRALAAWIPPEERLVTIESEFELLLHEMPDRHYDIAAMESQPGGPERDPTGRPVGQITEDELLEAALRMVPRRILLGEVRGREAAAMLRAMSTGHPGSMSTVHADSAYDAVDRIADLVSHASTGASEEFAYGRIASAINYIVHIGTIDERPIGGRLHRFVSEVAEIERGEGGRPAFNRIFAAPEEEPWGRAVPTRNQPRHLARLVRAGLDRSLLQYPNGQWPRPLDLMIEMTG